MIKKKLIISIIMAAMLFLAGCSGDKAQRLQQLEQLEQQNRSGQPMLNDSLAEDLVKYFDRHGDANERMRSRYILGRTYYCLDELPRALETYMEAADCADTTSADCNYKVLSRIHAQSAVIYDSQILPLNQLKELKLAEFYAQKGEDTLQAIECYAQQGDIYAFLGNTDSAIIIKEKASMLFENIGRHNRAYQTLGPIIRLLIKKGDLKKSRYYCLAYENKAGLFDEQHNIEPGREIYYSIKGDYYIAVGQIDSAEYMFRKELRDGKDLNNQIAACKGLQKVYEKKRIPDSIAKYATLSYEYNDSAYSVSEMQNIQKLQASYNYNHVRYLAEKKKLEAERAWLIVILVSTFFIIFGIHYGRKYWFFRKYALEYRLRNANITQYLKSLAYSNPPKQPTHDDWEKLRSFVEREVPSFRKKLRADHLSLSAFEYDVCLMVRVHLLPSEMSKLKKCVPSHISNVRKKLLLRIFGKEGRSEDFDDEIVKIV